MFIFRPFGADMRLIHFNPAPFPATPNVSPPGEEPRHPPSPVTLPPAPLGDEMTRDKGLIVCRRHGTAGEDVGTDARTDARTVLQRNGENGGEEVHQWSRKQQWMFSVGRKLLLLSVV